MRRFFGLCGMLALVGCPAVKPMVTPLTEKPEVAEDAAEALPEPDEVVAPCLAVDDLGALDWTWLDGTRLELCAGYDPVMCVGLDAATGAWETRSVPDEAEKSARTRRSGAELLDVEAIEAAGGEHEFCAPGGERCHTAKLGKGRPVWRSFSGDGAMVAYTLHVGAVEMDFPDAMAFLVFDTATGKLLKKHVNRDENFRCGGARFVDRWLLVGLDVCAGPGGIAWLMDARSGRKVADIGGKESFGNYEPQVHVMADAIAVLEQTGTRFAVHDRKTGAFRRIVEVVPYGELETEAYGNTLWALPDGDLLIALNGVSTGTVPRVDGATLGLKQRYQIARCPMP